MKRLFFLNMVWICCLMVTGSAWAQAKSEGEHILAPSDAVEVKVFQESDLDSKVTISKDGKVALPLIGQVAVAGLTTEAAARLISLKYKDGYLVNPSVTVSVAQYAKRRFTILGQVAKPNSYYFPEGEGLTLLQAIGIAGGYTRTAKESDIIIKRGEGGAVIKVDGKKLTEGGANAYPILPGDLIKVGESAF